MRQRVKWEAGMKRQTEKEGIDSESTYNRKQRNLTCSEVLRPIEVDEKQRLWGCVTDKRGNDEKWKGYSEGRVDLNEVNEEQGRDKGERVSD